MLSDLLGGSQFLRLPWIVAKRVLPDLGNLPDALNWSAARGAEYRRTRPPEARTPRVILSANPGRAGSAFLADLLNLSPTVQAGHEPRPRMTGPFLAAVVEAPMADSRDLRYLKVAAMDRAIAELPATVRFADTSNMFIKTYWDVVEDGFERADVVVLRRDPARILRSFVELGYFHDRNPSWPDWMADPVGPNRAVAPLWEVEARSPRDPVERGIAYLVDIEGRIEALKMRENGFRYIETSLEELLTPEGRAALFAGLGIEPPGTGEIPAPPAANTKDGWKEHLRKDDISVEELRGRIREYLDAADRPQITLPEMVRSW